MERAKAAPGREFGFRMARVADVPLGTSWDLDDLSFVGLA